MVPEEPIMRTGGNLLPLTKLIVIIKIVLTGLIWAPPLLAVAVVQVRNILAPTAN